MRGFQNGLIYLSIISSSKYKNTEINTERDNQWEKKLKKVKISNNAEDWKEIKNILGLGKSKLIYPDFIKADGKKATMENEKIKLFENTMK